MVRYSDRSPPGRAAHRNTMDDLGLAIAAAMEQVGRSRNTGSASGSIIVTIGT